MARNNNRNNEEPNTAPKPGHWYNLTLGPSFKEHHNHPSTKICTLRYEFKPASIDKSQAGSLHKGKDNKVTVEYQNNQYGKPKVTFEGVSEDYRENDAVLFFDGETLQLERLHRAVKRLRHVRLPGETASSTVSTTMVSPAVETYSSPINKATNQQSNKGLAQQMQAHTEQVGFIGLQSLEHKEENTPDHPSAMSVEQKNYEGEENVEIVDEENDNCETGSRDNARGKGSRTLLDIDINMPHQAETDDEIADVDISDDEVEKGPNAAEALRAQVNAEEEKEQVSTSSSSSTSDTSGSGSASGSDSASGSSSTDSESSENDSVLSI